MDAFLCILCHCVQESVYQSLQRNDAQNDLTKASSSNSKQNHDCDQSGGGDNPSETMNVDSQLAADEALARRLQEFENLCVDTSFSEFTGAEAGKSKWFLNFEAVEVLIDMLICLLIHLIQYFNIFHFCIPFYASVLIFHNDQPMPLLSGIVLATILHTLYPLMQPNILY